MEKEIILKEIEKMMKNRQHFYCFSNEDKN